MSEVSYWTKEIIFTSGATESNNLAIKGLADFYGDKKNHIITCVTEHKCVLESCRLLSEKGFEVTYLQVNKDGLVDLKDLESKINEKTLLVSINFSVSISSLSSAFVWCVTSFKVLR